MKLIRHTIFGGIFTFFCLCAGVPVHAQYLEQPVGYNINEDPEIVQQGHIAYLNEHFGECMVDDELDGSCEQVLGTTSLIIPSTYPMEDISWLSHFVNLESFTAVWNHIVLPESLPASLERLVVYRNKINSLEPLNFPERLTYLDISGQQPEGVAGWSRFPDFPESLKTLIAEHNQLSGSISLPEGLEVVNLSNNSITNIDVSSTVTSLTLNNNDLVTLPAFADESEIKSLSIVQNSLTGSLSSLPSGLTNLNLSSNSISSLNLSGADNLRSLTIASNNLTSINNIPISLLYLYAQHNQLANLDLDGTSLVTVDVQENLLTTIENIPSTLSTLYCNDNIIESFTFAGNVNLEDVNFSDNNFEEFPLALASPLRILSFVNNNISNIPELHEGLLSIEALGNEFTCLPNLPSTLKSTDIKSFCGVNSWIGTNGNFATASNWSLGVPTSGDNVIIFSGDVIIDESVTLGNLNLRGVNFSGSGTLSVIGDITGYNDSFALPVIFSGNSRQVTKNVQYYQNLTIDNSNGLILEGTTPEIDVLYVENGYLDLNGTTMKTSGPQSLKAIGTSNGTSIVRNGAIQHEQNISVGWNFLGTMMKGQKLSDLNSSVPLTFGGARQNIFDYDGTKTVDYGWTAPAGLSAGFPVGRGYKVYSFESRAAVFSGLPYSGAVDYNVTYDEEGYDNGGWNLVSNPYLCTIDWEAIAKTNIGGAVYIWNPKTESYNSYVGGNSTGSASQYIEPGQAFFVKASGTEPSLVINESAKETNNSGSFIRQGSNPALSLILENGSNEDELIIAMDGNSSFGFDSESDALKLMGNRLNLSLEGEDGKLMSINTIPDAEGVWPLYVNSSGSGTFTIKSKGVEVFEGVDVYLIDEFTGSKTLLGNETEYNFTLNSATENDRFKLSFEKIATSIIEEEKLVSHVYPNPTTDKVSVVLKQAEDVTLQLINPVGAEVLTISETGKDVINIPLEGINGVYILKISAGDSVQVYKIIKI